MTVRLLGPVEALDDDQVALPIGGVRRRSLLAVLALRSPAAASRDQIITALWGEEPPETAINTIQAHVSGLRKALGSTAIVTVGDGYRLGADVEVDALEVEAVHRAARLAETDDELESSRRSLREALACWRGPALADLRDIEFAGPEATRLDEMRLSMLEQCIDADLDAGCGSEVIGELEVLIGEHPWRESLRALLMRALYQSGRQADALAAYDAARTELLDHLGLDPSPALRDLHVRILDQTEPLPTRAASGQGATRSGPTRATDTPFPAALALVRSGPFVGRRAEVDVLTSALSGAVAHGPMVVSLAGEPGIGKTRLAAEAAFELDRHGATVLFGRCTTEPVWAFEPFANALGGPIGQVGHPTDPSSRRAGGGGADDERAVQLGALVARFEELTATGPVVLILDDVHWATEATAIALRHLVRTQRPLPLLVITTYRDTDLRRGDPIAEVLNELRRDHRAHEVDLVGLDEDAITELISLAGAEGADTAIDVADRAASLRARTGGNPLFVGELLRHLDESPADATLPRGIREVIARRVAGLGTEAVRVLQAAAVLGPTFNVPLLAAMGGVADDIGLLVDALDAALDAQLIADERVGSPGDYTFGHALIRQTLHDELSTPRRAQLHDHARRAIESVYGASPDWLAALAHHAFEGAAVGGVAAAVRYAIIGSRAAMQRYDYSEAADIARRGLDCLRASPTASDRAELTYLVASGELWGGRWEDGLALMSTVLDLARAEPDPVTFAHAAIDLLTSTTKMGAESPHGVEYLEEALELLGQTELELRVELLCELAYYEGTSTGDLFTSRTRSAEALALARETDDPELILCAKGYHDELLWEAPAYQERAALGDEMARLPTDGVDPWFLDHERYYAARLAFEQGDPAFRSHLAHLDAGRQRGGEIDGLDDAWRAFLALIDGDFESAELHNTSGLSRVRRPNSITCGFAQLFILRREQGRNDEIVRLLEVAVLEAPDAVGMRAALSLAYAELGDANRAWTTLCELDAVGFQALAALPTWTSAAMFGSEVTIRVGNPHFAGALTELLTPFSGGLMVPGLNAGCLGAADRALGQLAAARGDLAQAIGHYEQAELLEARVGAPALLARTRYWHARALIELGGDSARAGHELAAAASETSANLGMTLLAAECAALVTPADLG